jgi:hypothetical protein
MAVRGGETRTGMKKIAKPQDAAVAAARPRLLCKSAAPVILSYLDGTWTDRLAGKRMELGHHAGAAVLTIELAFASGRPSARAKADVGAFLRNCNRVESVQIAKRSVRKRLRALLHEAEVPRFSVRLSAAGRDVVYPASAYFGPDAVTLNLG